jgi:hypothetical protein
MIRTRKTKPLSNLIAHQAFYEMDKRKEDKVFHQFEITIGGVVRSSRATSIFETRDIERDSISSPFVLHLTFFRELDVGYNLPSYQWLKERRKKKQIGLWGGAFNGVTYLLALLRPIHFSMQCLMLSLLLA